MRYPFNPYGRLIVVPATLHGPLKEVNVHLALDTGATTTVISEQALQYVGCETDTTEKPVEITTASGKESVFEIRIDKLCALGKVVTDLAILCHTLPPGAGFDGVLGLDFLRGRRLTIDFRAGLLSLE